MPATEEPQQLQKVDVSCGTGYGLVLIHAPAARLGEIVRGLQLIGNLDGLLVTVPHKVAGCKFADTSARRSLWPETVVADIIVTSPRETRLLLRAA